LRGLGLFCKLSQDCVSQKFIHQADPEIHFPA
jgi:hypothetical protein